MIINAKLNANTQATVDITEAIILPENELKIACSTDIYTIYTLFVSARNGEKEIKQKIKKPFVADLSSLLMPGRIEIEISSINNGEIVKSWRVADILVKDVNHTYNIIPEIAELHEEINGIKSTVKELYELIKHDQL